MPGCPLAGAAPSFMLAFSPLASMTLATTRVPPACRDHCSTAIYAVGMVAMLCYQTTASQPRLLCILHWRQRNQLKLSQPTARIGAHL